MLTMQNGTEDLTFCALNAESNTENTVYCEVLTQKYEKKDETLESRKPEKDDIPSIDMLPEKNLRRKTLMESLHALQNVHGKMFGRNLLSKRKKYQRHHEANFSSGYYAKQCRN